MIKVIVSKKNNQIVNIKISGHSNYAESGYDIVCAGVSSIVTTTINAILSFKKTIKIISDGNPLEFEVIELDEITSKLINNMLNLLKEMEKDYKKYLRTEEREC